MPAVRPFHAGLAPSWSTPVPGQVARFELDDRREVVIHVPQAVACRAEAGEVAGFRIEVWRPGRGLAAVLTAGDLVGVFGAQDAVRGIEAFLAGDLGRARELVARAGGAWVGLGRLLRRWRRGAGGRAEGSAVLERLKLLPAGGEGLGSCAGLGQFAAQLGDFAGAGGVGGGVGELGAEGFGFGLGGFDLGEDAVELALLGEAEAALLVVAAGVPGGRLGGGLLRGLFFGGGGGGGEVGGGLGFGLGGELEVEAVVALVAGDAAVGFEDEEAVATRSRNQRSWVTTRAVPPNSMSISSSAPSVATSRSLVGSSRRTQVAAACRQLGEGDAGPLAAGERADRLRAACAGRTGSARGSLRDLDRLAADRRWPCGSRRRCRRRLRRRRGRRGAGRSRRAGCSCRARPCPWRAATWPVIARSSVVLPAPLGPTMPRRSPVREVKVEAVDQVLARRSRAPRSRSSRIVLPRARGLTS